MSQDRFLGVFASGLLAAMFAAIVMASGAGAQSAPRPSGSCTGQLTLTTGLVGVSRELAYAASGLEPDAPCTIFIAGREVARATTTGAGTTSGSVFVPDVVGTAGVEMQVTAASTCASGTLTVVGSRSSCLLVDGVIMDCPFGFSPIVGLPFVAPFVPVNNPSPFCVSQVVNNELIVGC